MTILFFWGEKPGHRKKLKRGKIDREAFQCDYGDSTIEKIQTEIQDMGLIAGFTVNEKDKMPPNFDPGFVKI